MKKFALVFIMLFSHLIPGFSQSDIDPYFYLPSPEPQRSLSVDELIKEIENMSDADFFNFLSGSSSYQTLDYTPPPFMQESYQPRTFQLGSFLIYQNALNLVSRLEREGFTSGIERAVVNNSVFWRVIIINISGNEAAPFRRLLESAGFTEIWVR